MRRSGGLRAISFLTGVIAGLAAAIGPLLAAGAAMANLPPAPDAAALYPPTRFLTQRETWAGLAVLVFGLLLALMAVFLVKTRTLGGADTIRLVALILIVTGTLFLVTAGYSAEQIAPALGLLGTVAGYMLGRAERREQQREEKDAPP